MDHRPPQRVRLHAPGRLLGILLAGLLVAGCGSSPSEVEATRAALDDASDRISEQDNVTEVFTGWDGSTGLDMVDSIIATVLIDVDDEQRATEVAERSIELLWHSDVPEVSLLQVTVEMPSRDRVTGIPEVGRVLLHDDLEERFGPRD